MTFQFKNQAYSYAFWFLWQFKEKCNAGLHKAIDSCVTKIKIAIENHEQDPSVIGNYLRELLAQFPESDLSLRPIRSDLDILISNIENSNYSKANISARFENPLARLLESQLAIELLLHPSQAMMTAVGRMSAEILKLMSYLSKRDVNELLRVIQPMAGPIVLGAFKVQSLREVKKILRHNDPAQLAEIMHIHFKVISYISRNVPISDAPKRPPVGKLANILEVGWKKPDDFFNGIGELTESGRRCRSFIPDTVFCRSELYTKEPGRGRHGALQKNPTNRLGIMTKSHGFFESQLPVHTSQWIADSKSQGARLDSLYVRDLVMNDAIYVAGPSSMTALLLGQMEFMGNFETIELKQLYCAAVAAYIVGGGFHSWHEVLGPAQFVLGLIPGYQVSPPQDGILAAPPNYHLFVEQQMRIDPEFKVSYDRAWLNYARSLDSIYKVIPQKTCLAIIEELDRYINSRQIGFNRVITKLFRDERLTIRKTQLAQDLKDVLTSPNVNVHAFLISINRLISYNQSVEKISNNPDTHQLTHSGFERCLFAARALLIAHCRCNDIQWNSTVSRMQAT